MLAYIADQTPKRVDNFETLSSFWNWTNCESNNRYVSDGELFLKDCETTADYIYILDFVAEVNVRIEQGYGSVGLKMGNKSDCRINIGNVGTGPYSSSLNMSAYCKDSDLGSGYIPYSSTMNLLIIVKGNDFAYYINQKPMGFAENQLIPGFYPNIGLYSQKNEGVLIGAFSDFKLWDITGLDIP